MVWRFNKRRRSDKERGVVLLTTLLVMSIMAAVAVSIMDDVRFGVKRVANIHAHAQADWYALAAYDFAQSYLSEQKRTVDESTFNAALYAAQPAVFPIDGGVISLRVRDGSQCLSLTHAGTSAGARQLGSLLKVLGWPDYEATQLAAVIADWQDADTQVSPNGAEDYTYLGAAQPYRTPNTAFSSVMELRAVAGMTEERYALLQPFLCARPESANSQLNINGLLLSQAPLLASLLGDDQLELAKRLISERPSGGYTDAEQLKTSSSLEGLETTDIDFDSMSYSPEFIWVEADIAFLNATRFMAMEFSVVGNSVTPLRRYHSQDARRPVFKSEGNPL